MRITEYCVKRPIFTTIIYVVLLLLSVISLAKLPVDLMPEITLPMLTVITSYPGANAQDIETKVTKTIEDAVRTVPGIDSVESTSKEGASVVVAKFDWGTSLDTASNDIRDRLEFIKSRLPEDTDTPRVIKFNTSAIPILFMGANAKESYDRLNEIMETDIADKLRSVPGVGAVYVRGGKIREIQIILDINKMNAYNISLSQVAAKIQQENVTVPAGSVYEGKRKYSLRVPGEYTTVAELTKTLLAYRQGKPIYVSDIAEVKDDFQEAIKRVHVNQKNGGFIVVQKQSGSNTVIVAKGVREKLKTILQTLPKDVDVKILMDNSDFIVNSINSLKTSIYWGGFLVVLVLLFFLRNIRASFIAALEIPTSLLVAFIFVYFNGWTINILTLASLAIAIGMVVDNAIVVIDNIYRHLYEGERPQEAAIFGTGEIGAAILGSTLTTVVIFLPLIFVGGFLQVYFKQLAAIVTITLMASLFVAYTLSPMLAGKLLSQKSIHGNDSATNNTIANRIFRRSEKWFERMDEKYQRILGWALHNRKKVIAGAIAVFVFSLLLFPLVGTEFFPREDQGFLRLRVELPRGTSVDETEKAVSRIEQILQEEVKELRMLMVDMGESREAMGSVQGGRKELSSAADFFGKLVPKDQRKRSDLEIIEAIRPRIEKIPGLVKVNFSSQDPMEQAIMGSGKPLTIELYGDDLAKGSALSDQISDMMSKIKGVQDVEISFEQGNPEIWVRVDREKATSLGLSVNYIANIVRGTFYGVTVSKFRDQDDEYDIFMNLNKAERTSLANLMMLPILLPSGKTIPLGNVAILERQYGPLEIIRKDGTRMIRIDASVYGRSLGEVTADVENLLQKKVMPRGFTYKFGGTIKEQKSSFADLFFAFILGILLVYLIMAAQFESLRDPFIIMFSVPFAITGVIWGLLVAGLSFNVMTFLGLIMLVGIVVNNAIVLVDYTNILRARGIELFEAVQRGGKNRLRPVLMTTITTLFGLVPMAFSRGEGSESWSPMGVALIGGLTVSTLITLIFVPVLYTIFEQKFRRNDSTD